VNDIYRLEFAKSMRKLHYAALCKIQDNFFQTIANAVLLLQNQIHRQPKLFLEKSFYKL